MNCMKRAMTVEQMATFFGMEKRNFQYWRKRKINFEELIQQLINCERHGCERKLIYEAFLKVTDEAGVDRVWNSYIRHRLNQKELEEQKKIIKKKLQKMIQEKREGRVL